MQILGMTPPDVSGALFRGKNLSDVVDKVAARENLEVPSKEDVLYAGVPIGTIISFWGITAPQGFLPCDGQVISSDVFPELVEFLNPSGSSATLPDLRGEFLRGWDKGRGVDLGRAVKTSQGFATESHNHYLPTGSNTSSDPYPSIPDSAFTSSDVDYTAGSQITTYPNQEYLYPSQVGSVGTFANETRPRNVSVLYCIKAFNCVRNYTSGLNIAGLASDYAVMAADALKTSWFASNQSLGDNGYQKIPGGLIVQWGSANSISGKADLYNFPISFPKGVLSIVACEGSAATWGNTPTPSVFGTAKYSNSQFQVWSVRVSNAGVSQYLSGLNFKWIALGY